METCSPPRKLYRKHEADKFLAAMRLDPDCGDFPFKTTRWSLVLSVQDLENSQARNALAELCNTYWRPIYGFLRRRRYSHHDAQDLTQSFFVSLLHNESIQQADRTRGRFRSYLLGSLTKFLANEWDRQHAQKRGGHLEIHSLDAEDAEKFLAQLPADLPAETIYELSWADTTVKNALKKLRDKAVARGRTDLFEALQVHLIRDESSQEQTAETLGISVNAVHTLVHRLRRAYRDALREEIAETVTTSTDIDEELRYLRQVLESARHRD
jgi:RNA polymerase sigma factor (sigma-70 family)